MAYSNRFVVNVLLNGRIQKELQSGEVHIPFGEQYSLRFRNKHNRRAVVKFFLDGENVSGNGYIIPANDYVDIERHHDIDRAFKFVELDSEDAQDAGKNGPNVDGSKGLLEARFYLEKKPTAWVAKPVEYHHWYYPNTWPTLSNPYVPPSGPTWTTWGNSTSSDTLRSCGAGGQSHSLGDIPAEIKCSTQAPDISVTCSNVPEITPIQDGVTVEGNITGQCFTSSYVDLENECTTIKVVIKGTSRKEEPVPMPNPQKPSVQYCTNCGAKKGKRDKFCGQCGTKL